MEDFSVMKTAFGGFRLLAARPMTAVWWLAFAVLISLIQIVVTVQMAGPQLAALSDMRQAGQVDPASAMAITRGLAPFYLFTYVFPWLVGAVTLGAASRAVLRPDQAAAGYFRFGADEGRLLVTTLVLAVIFILILVVSAIMGGIVMVTVGGQPMLRGMQAAGGFSAQAGGLFLAGMVPGLLIMGWLAARLSLAPAQTVAERTIQIFGSWPLTRGRFWKTLAVYVLGSLPALALTAIMYAIMFSGEGSMQERMSAMQTSMTSLGSAFEARHLVSYVLNAAARVLFMAGVLVPAALIYQSVAIDEASVFDDDDDED